MRNQKNVYGEIDRLIMVSTVFHTKESTMWNIEFFLAIRANLLVEMRRYSFWPRRYFPLPEAPFNVTSSIR